MSASREKKRRQEYLAANGGVDPKAVREAERQAAEKKSKILYTTIAVAFVALAAVLLVYNSGIIQRNRAAVTIDGEKYTAADVSYYYYNAYQQFMTSGYGSYFINTSQPLSSQTCVFNSEMTWADYFKDEAVTTMKLVHAAAKAAETAGIKLDEEDLSKKDANIATMKAQATANNYSYENYLTAMFGNYMTPEVFEKNLELSLLANKYTTDHYDSLTYTDEEIQKYYEENKNTYDRVDGTYVTIAGKPETKKDDAGNTIEPTEEEKAAALDEAKTLAENILATHKAGEDLEAYVKALTAAYNSSKELSYSDTTVMNWLFSEDRVEGDCEILFDEESSTYYVAIFNNRYREETLDYNIRHILVTEENLNLPEGKEAGEGEVMLAAQAIMDSWDKTEESFIELAKQHSKDGNASTGGLYENVMKGQMVSSFNDWCYAEGRQPGDYGIVESDYGCHIMYFVGYGTTEYWYAACKTAMADEAYQTWETELMGSVTAEVKGGMKLIG